MKFLFDLFPVILFFVAFKVADIYVATGGRDRARRSCRSAGSSCAGARSTPMLWVEPRASSSCSAARRCCSRTRPSSSGSRPCSTGCSAPCSPAALLVFRRNLMRTLLAEQLELPDAVWRKLNWSWVGFFAFMGVAQPVRRLQLLHRRLGQLQAVRRHGADAPVRAGAGRCSSSSYVQEEKAAHERRRATPSETRLAALDARSARARRRKRRSTSATRARQGGGGHYRLTIVSPRFRGRHARGAPPHGLRARSAPLMQREIHALAIQALRTRRTMTIPNHVPERILRCHPVTSGACAVLAAAVAVAASRRTRRTRPPRRAARSRSR